MVLPAVFLIHSATLHQMQKNFTLAYDGGTAVFTAGKTLTGATSHATAIIVSTGASATGTLTLHTITGTFANDEAITDNNGTPGAAVVNGVIAEAFDTNGELAYTDVTATVSCRFIGPQKSFRGKPVYIVSTPRVLLPAGTAVSEGDTLTSTETGYAETFRINSVNISYEAAVKTVSHISCDIAAVV